MHEVSRRNRRCDQTTRYPDDETRKLEWMRAMNVMRKFTEQRTRETNVVQQIMENMTLDASETTQQKTDDLHSHNSITEKEAAAEKHAHTTVYRAIEDAYDAADAEDTGVRAAWYSVYDSKGVIHRHKVTDNATKLWHRWAECVEGMDQQVKFRDEAYESYMTAMNSASIRIEDTFVQHTHMRMAWKRWCKRWWSRRELEQTVRDGRAKKSGIKPMQTDRPDIRSSTATEQCPRAPVYRGSGDIDWCSSAAERARQAATRLCGRVIVFTTRHDCFALTSSVLHVGDSSSSWGEGLRAAGFENIIKRYNKSNRWIEISAKEFGNDPHEFVKRVEYNGGTVLTHGGNRYIDSDTIIRNTYEDIDTVQITFDREGRVIRHSSIQRTGNSRMTQLLLNVEDGYGHVVVMVGNAADVIRRCNEQCEPTEITVSSQEKLNEDNTEEFYEIMATKFQKIYYGMADAEDTTENYVTNCEPEVYLRMVNLGVLEQTGSRQLVEDAVTIHTDLTGHHTGDTDVNESTLLTLANTQDMLTQFRQISQRALLIADRRGHGRPRLHKRHEQSCLVQSTNQKKCKR